MGGGDIHLRVVGEIADIAQLAWREDVKRSRPATSRATNRKERKEIEKDERERELVVAGQGLIVEDVTGLLTVVCYCSSLFSKKEENKSAYFAAT